MKKERQLKKKEKEKNQEEKDKKEEEEVDKRTTFMNEIKFKYLMKPSVK